jgi:hypothetical protein
MRVKLIGVSDEARKSESVARAKQDYRPRERPRYLSQGEIECNILKEFDRFFAENKLPYPT